ncbi:radical SAM protein [candidate division WOR-3 bacterium]|nr:radical SAM protein [candidate division WOR-3 bacterium]
MVEVKDLGAKALKGVASTAVRSSTIRKLALKKIESEMYKSITLKRADTYPPKQIQDVFCMGDALLHSADRSMSCNISSGCRNAIINILAKDILTGGDIKTKEKFESEFGFIPPLFLTISPSNACNLRCKGCYANAGVQSADKLTFDVFDRIIQETRELWGSHFAVISGGEPLLYKGIFEIAEKHKDTFFLMYTNGTLIDEKVARRLAEVGNVTPAISVEGFEKETDARRGKGVYKRIRKAMQNLKDAGVPFGLSITATKQNVDIITSDEFYDFYFEKEPKATYGWIFHYMPIGRSYTIELMPTPEQRLLMWEKNREMVRKQKILIADFWNDGVVSNGCISAGRTGGYFYINWNGDCTPCVFQPYAVHNINKVYKNGGNLNTVLNSEFFKAIRKWQNEYGYGQPKDKKENLLRPCAIRDHYGTYHKLLECYKPYPIDKSARDALNDEEYRKKLTAYGEKIGELTKDIWEKEYLQSGR